MLGERIAPCWCYSPIHFEWRRTRVQGDALVRQSVTLNTPCDVDKRIYFTPWRDTGRGLARRVPSNHGRPRAAPRLQNVVICMTARGATF